MENQQLIERLVNKIDKLEEKIDEMHFALKGDSLTNSGGLGRRMESTERELGKIWGKIDSLEKKDIEMEKKNIKSGVYLYLLVLACGFVLCALFQYVIKSLLK